MTDRAPVRITLADIASAMPDLLLAASFLIAWVDPSVRVVPSVRRLVMIVLLELFIPPIVFRRERAGAALAPRTSIVPV